jgi:putative transposase
VRAHRAHHAVTTLCRLLEISTSGDYAWMTRPASRRAQADAELLDRIRAIHDRSRGTYGVPRVHAELAAQGVHVSRKRIARLMRAAGLVGVSRRKRPRTTIRAQDARPAPDLVERNFAAAGPDQLWVADLTYIPTWAGFLYLAVVLDAWSRRVVGWAMATHLRTELVLDALNMAFTQRRPTAVIHHSDQGCQPGFKVSSQQCLVGSRVGIRPGPRPASSSRVFCGAGY